MKEIITAAYSFFNKTTWRAIKTILFCSLLFHQRVWKGMKNTNLGLKHDSTSKITGVELVPVIKFFSKKIFRKINKKMKNSNDMSTRAAKPELQHSSKIRFY